MLKLYVYYATIIPPFSLVKMKNLPSRNYYVSVISIIHNFCIPFFEPYIQIIVLDSPLTESSSIVDSVVKRRSRCGGPSDVDLWARPKHENRLSCKLNMSYQRDLFIKKKYNLTERILKKIYHFSN